MCSNFSGNSYADKAAMPSYAQFMYNMHFDTVLSYKRFKMGGKVYKKLRIEVRRVLRAHGLGNLCHKGLEIHYGCVTKRDYSGAGSLLSALGGKNREASGTTISLQPDSFPSIKILSFIEGNLEGTHKHRS